MSDHLVAFAQLLVAMFVAAVLVAALTLGGSVIVGVNFEGESCHRLERMGRPTRFEWDAYSYTCLVKVDGTWIDADTYYRLRR